MKKATRSAAYNVHWADGRAVAAYANERLAKKAAVILDADRITRGPAMGRIHTDLPKRRG